MFRFAWPPRTALLVAAGLLLELANGVLDANFLGGDNKIEWHRARSTWRPRISCPAS